MLKCLKVYRRVRMVLFPIFLGIAMCILWASEGVIDLVLKM